MPTVNLFPPVTTILLFASLVLLAAPTPPRDFHRFHAATVESVYDGDTVTVDIDLGLKTWIRAEKVRLYGLNAPEVRGVDKQRGLVSRDHLIHLLGDRKVVLEIPSDTHDKYGRLLATIWVSGYGSSWCGAGNWCNVNERMVADGHAVYAEY